MAISPREVLEETEEDVRDLKRLEEIIDKELRVLYDGGEERFPITVKATRRQLRLIAALYSNVGWVVTVGGDGTLFFHPRREAAEAAQADALIRSMEA